MGYFAGAKQFQETSLVEEVPVVEMTSDEVQEGGPLL